MSEKYPETAEVLQSPSAVDDFYRFINQQAIQENPIPSSEAWWGPFNIVRDKTYRTLRGIAENLQGQEAEKGSNEQLVRDFYASGMDMDTRNKRGIQPLNELRALIGNMTNASEVLAAVATLSTKGSGTFFGVGFDEDKNKAGSNALYMWQGGIGLPDRDYYLKDDDEMAEVREKYMTHISTIFQLSGREKEAADKAAHAVYGIEYALAEASLPNEEAREIDKNYFKFTLDEAKREFPDIDWDAYFTTLGKPDIKDFVIMQPQFIKKVGDILTNADIEDIKDYMEFNLIDDFSDVLSDDFVAENFDFKGRTLSGMEKPRDLWKKVIMGLHGTKLTQAIGPLYCQEGYFTPVDKRNAEEMTDDIVEAFRRRLTNLDWMQPETKEIVRKKMANISYKLGYPDTWIDVSSINIRPDTYAENYMALIEFSRKRELARLEEPYDRSEWHMVPTVVNACSDQKREMTFPAALFQPPFYDRTADKAYNYGWMGMTIGHEYSHFFDDQGCKYDPDGNMKEWWSDEDKQNFQKRAQQFVDYFGSVEVNGLRLNGQLTLGENIADVAGILLAFDALQLRLEKEGKLDEIIDGMTWQQRFFVGYTMAEWDQSTPEYAQEAILTDPHAPSEVRVNGVLAINQAFHEAFDVKPGDKMYVAPDDQPTLW